jgi:hypothetical protein
LGRAAEALHFALCQSVPAGPGAAPVIHVFPAWPTNWDAAFTLLCRGGFLVTASITKGTIDLVEIEAPHGGTCRIKNPWPGKQVAIYINNKKRRSTSDNGIEISTKANDHIVLLPPGGTLTNARKKIL